MLPSIERSEFLHPRHTRIFPAINLIKNGLELQAEDEGRGLLNKVVVIRNNRSGSIWRHKYY